MKIWFAGTPGIKSRERESGKRLLNGACLAIGTLILKHIRQVTLLSI